MSDKKETRGELTKVRSIVKPQSTAMPDTPFKTSELFGKDKKLTLDEENKRRAKTRTELYNELANKEKVLLDEDFFEFSNPVVRGVALAIDAAFTYGLVKFSLLAAPSEVKLLHLLFLDKYNLEFMFGEKILLTTTMGINIFIALFLFIVIPVAFFNLSLGKKLTGQRVRGDDKYTISIGQAFQREIIYKPISIACLVGFILPFFDKKKKSLHDKMAGTFVIKE